MSVTRGTTTAMRIAAVTTTTDHDHEEDHRSL
jgi:hypothetical protein